jgi:hypothetical protein
MFRYYRYVRYGLQSFYAYLFFLCNFFILLKIASYVFCHNTRQKYLIKCHYLFSQDWSNTFRSSRLPSELEANIDGKMADRQRRSRYLTISILHIITIMCQGMWILLWHTAILEFERETFPERCIAYAHNIILYTYEAM